MSNEAFAASLPSFVIRHFFRHSSFVIRHFPRLARHLHERSSFGHRSRDSARPAPFSPSAFSMAYISAIKPSFQLRRSTRRKPEERRSWLLSIRIRPKYYGQTTRRTLITATPAQDRASSAISSRAPACPAFRSRVCSDAPEDFVRQLAANSRPLAEICVGHEWSFGKGRAGNLALLKTRPNAQLHVVGVEAVKVKRRSRQQHRDPQSRGRGKSRQGHPDAGTRIHDSSAR